MARVPNYWLDDNFLASPQKDFLHPRPIPYSPINWPNQSGLQVQIQQIKTASQPAGLTNTAQGSQQLSTVNMPKPVAGVSLRSEDIGNGQVRMIVGFQHDPSDPNFSKANIHIKTASGTVQMASATQSPVSFVVSRAAAPTGSVVVQTEGNWGRNPIENSPSKAFSFARANTIVSSTAQAISGGGSGGSTPPAPPPPTPPVAAPVNWFYIW